MTEPTSEAYFKNYYTTHVVGRDGAASLQSFERKKDNFEHCFGRFLPQASKSNELQIVDLGCGLGELVWWLQGKGFTHAHGVDLSSEQVKIAQQLSVKNIECADFVEHLEMRKSFYDLVFMRDVLEHFPKSQVIPILDRVKASLKPGGKIVIQVPNAESPFFGRIRYGDFTHESAFCQSSIQQIFKLAGYAQVEIYPVPPRFKTLRSLIRFPLWKFTEWCFRMFLFAELGRGKRIVTQNLIAVATKD